MIVPSSRSSIVMHGRLSRKPSLWSNRDFLDPRRRERLTHATVRSPRGWRFGKGVNDLDTLRHTREDHIRRRQRIVLVHDEKLAAVSVRTGIGHRENPAAVAVAVGWRVRLDLV